MKKKSCIIMIIVLLLAGGCFAYYKYINNKKVNEIQTYLQNNYGDKCSIDYNAFKNEFTLSYIDAGYDRDDLKDLFAKNDSGLKQWNYIVNEYKNKCSDIKKDIKRKYKQDVNVSYVCEDENKEILINVVNGEVKEKYF